MFIFFIVIIQVSFVYVFKSHTKYKPYAKEKKDAIVLFPVITSDKMA